MFFKTTLRLTLLASKCGNNSDTGDHSVYSETPPSERFFGSWHETSLDFILASDSSAAAILIEI